VARQKNLAPTGRARLNRRRAAAICTDLSKRMCRDHRSGCANWLSVVYVNGGSQLFAIRAHESASPASQRFLQLPIDCLRRQPAVLTSRLRRTVKLMALIQEEAECPNTGPLRDHLANAGPTPVILTFAEIEGILGDSLPPSAYQHKEWWANETDDMRHTQSLAWTANGRRAVINLHARTVLFAR